VITLYDTNTGAYIGTLSEDQLQFLQAHLEEESPEDTDYYLNPATLTLLEQAGADAELLRLLRQALGERDEVEIRWERQEQK
jgi:processive 1,2-diacylglycerol beta-glucosyltransferase